VQGATAGSPVIEDRDLGMFADRTVIDDDRIVHVP
jgi:hypothetical protein